MMDLVKAFRQILIAEKDQMKTVVKTPWGCSISRG